MNGPMRPSLSSAPSVEDLAAVSCPIERAALITRISRQCGTLSRPLAELRRLALLEARAAGHAVAGIAAQVGLSKARVFQLTARVVPAS